MTGRLASVREMSLQFVKNVRVKFCPWEKSAAETRTFFGLIATNKMRESNPNCKFVTSVKHDGSPPEVLIEFDDGKKLLFKSQYLLAREMAKRFQTVQQMKEEAAVTAEGNGQ